MKLPLPSSNIINSHDFKSELDNLLKLDDEETDNSYGCIPENRPLDEYLHYGLVPLDKPSGPTSHEVVSWVKRLLDANKAGHSGTLDPGVTGLLPIGLGAAANVFVGQVGSWLPWDPDCEQVQEQEYQEQMLNDLVKKYKENLDSRDNIYDQLKESFTIPEE